MIKRVDDNTIFVNEDSGSVTFSTNEMDIFSVDHNNINTDDGKTIIN